jgi:DNA-binding protein HU-beta
MNKAELVKVVAEKSGIKRNVTEAVVNNLLTAIKEALKQGEKVTIAGFGTFEVVGRKERFGVNPATKEKIKIPATKVPKFRPSAALKEEVK